MLWCGVFMSRTVWMGFVGLLLLVFLRCCIWSHSRSCLERPIAIQMTYKAMVCTLMVKCLLLKVFGLSWILICVLLYALLVPTRFIFFAKLSRRGQSCRPLWCWFLMCSLFVCLCGGMVCDYVWNFLFNLNWKSYYFNNLIVLIHTK